MDDKAYNVTEDLMATSATAWSATCDWSCALFSVKILRSRPELSKRTLLAPVEVRSSDLEGSQHWKPSRSTIKGQEIAVAEIASD
jgi:hypothetical protein